MLLCDVKCQTRAIQKSSHGWKGNAVRSTLVRSLALSFSEYELHTVWHIEHRLTAMQFEFVELYRLRVWADDGDGDGGARDIAGF